MKVKINGSPRKDVRESIELIETAAGSPGWEGVAVVTLGHRRSTVAGRFARDEDVDSVELDIVGIEFATDPADVDVLRRVAEALHAKSTSAGTLDEGSAESLVIKHADALIGPQEGHRSHP